MTARRVGRQEQLERGGLEIVDGIYGAVSDPTRWLQVTRAVSSLFGGTTGLVLRTGQDLQKQRMIMTDLDPAFVQAYQDYYGALNPWARELFSQQADSGLFFNDSHDGVERTEFYADWLRPLGNLRFTFSGWVRLAGNEADIGLVGTRPGAMGPVDEQERRLLATLLPHVKRAMELSRRLSQQEAERTALTTAVQRLGAGVVLVDANRRLAFMDSEAERILSGGGGLTVRDGQLRAPTILDAQLGEAVASATGRGRIITGRSGSLLTIPRSHERPPLSVAVGPVDERDRPLGMVGPLAMVLITDPERSGRPTEESLRALFDLTPAEAKLVVGLCAGETLASYAEATGTSLNTVKTHLKHVFEKTGETRQADLIRRVSNDVALRLGTPP